MTIPIFFLVLLLSLLTTDARPAKWIPSRDNAVLIRVVDVGVHTVHSHQKKHTGHLDKLHHHGKHNAAATVNGTINSSAASNATVNGTIASNNATSTVVLSANGTTINVYNATTNGNTTIVLSAANGTIVDANNATANANSTIVLSAANGTTVDAYNATANGNSTIVLSAANSTTTIDPAGGNNTTTVNGTTIGDSVASSINGTGSVMMRVVHANRSVAAPMMFAGHGRKSVAADPRAHRGKGNGTTLIAITRQAPRGTSTSSLAHRTVHAPKSVTAEDDVAIDDEKGGAAL
ncbi:hypothetical protein BDK51DRAFT_53009 [Blyttiomyces helicus]|uniref:Uncharacterized protein n=1 Tax=Blyttiomyces helicus TaxID=388810 RepID=A0A4P9W681_9FUNG|nr:hypothetical protein BDK51DRAFT_53009 [Blyttiomyces helicus]|eukprot:RKO85616.1 hypothetical protein BDK51DRAFT_53009 [Blyttiomyces helicus]